MSTLPGTRATSRWRVTRLVHAIRARRQMEEQHQASLQQHQQRQSLLQNYDRAFSACLTGRGYSVQ